MADITEDELLEMGDDEFEQAQMVQDDIVENAEPVEVVNDVAEDAERAEAPVADVEEEEEEVIDEETEPAADDEEQDETETDMPADTKPSEEAEQSESHDNDTEETDVEDDDLNYETSFNAIMAPLNVSGKETVQVKSVDDMRNLARMGVDYSRKMRDIKPLRAIGETLTQAGIIVDGVINEEVLTRLIDINNGDANAIAQLVKEHEIDPLDIDTEDISYTPTASIVSDQTIALQDVEKELASRGSVEGVVSELNQLDDRSKQFFNESPENLLRLDDDIKSGAYKEIMDVVRYEKSLGRLNGMSDMEAYIQLAVGDEAPASTPAPRAKPRPSSAKRKAAGITKRAPATKQKKSYDYVNMSDEEFDALTPTTALY